MISDYRSSCLQVRLAALAVLALVCCAAVSAEAAVSFGPIAPIKNKVQQLKNKIDDNRGVSYTLSPSSRLLSAGAAALFISSSANAAGVTFVFSNQAAEIALLQPGNIMISNQGAGFLRKVVSVTPSGSNFIVETASATLEDAFQKLDLTFSHQLSPQNVIASRTRQRKGVAMRPSAVTGEWDVVIASAILYDRDGNPHTTNDQIIGVGDIKFSMTLDGLVRIPWMHLTEFKLSNTVTETTTLKVKWAADFGLSLPDDLASVELASYTLAPFTVGPVVFFPVISVVVGAKGHIGVSCSAESGITSQMSYTGGIWLQDGVWSPIADFTSSFNYNPPSFSYDASADIKGSAGPQLNIKIYDVAGPYVNVSGYVEDQAQAVLSPLSLNWSGIGGLEGSFPLPKKGLFV